MNHRLNHARAFTVLELVIVISVILVLMALALTVTSTVLAANDRRTMQNTFLMLDQAIVSWEAQAGRPLSFGRRFIPAGAVMPLPPPANGPDFTLSGAGPSEAFDIYEDDLLRELREYEERPHNICVVLERLANNPDSAEIISKIPTNSIRFVPMVAPAYTAGVEPLPTGWAQTTPATDPNQMPTPTATPAIPSPIREIYDPWNRRIAVIFPGRAATKAEIGAALANPTLIDGEDGTVRTSDEFDMGVCRNRKICFVSAGPDGNFATLDDNLYSYETLPRPAQ